MNFIANPENDISITSSSEIETSKKFMQKSLRAWKKIATKK
ncbi:hypothetical protein C4K04_3394 [Pseudomonas chlororaphis]|uniref:Uncharacterized protein n=1 Tax=Pseudomonas chlororaphis TaxID=587753 RepID=A0A3G7TS37_9PSED|nr:hypothetical protein C4K04_3394 [Pseudomonas chlororaphis]